MSALLAVIEELVVATVISEKVLLPRKSMMDWAFTALSVALTAVGVFLLILSLDRFLETLYPPDMAALVLAVLVFAAAFVAAVCAYHFRRQKVSHIGAARQELGNNIRGLMEDIFSQLDEPVRENPKAAVLLAAVAGFVTAQHQTRS